MSSSATAESGQGAVIGGWVCLALGTVFMFWTLFSFLLYLPLFLAAFVLGIVAIAQHRISHGITILLLAVVAPFVIGYGLSTYHTQQALEPIKTPSLEPTKTPSHVYTSDSLPIEGVRIGMSTSDISSLFPSLNPSWLNDIYIDKTGKKYLRRLYVSHRDVSRFSQDKIDSLSIQFKDFKVSVIQVHYDLPFNTDKKNIDGFQQFISQRYGILSDWSDAEKKEDYYRKIIIDGNQYEIGLHSSEGRDSGEPWFRVAPKGWNAAWGFE